MISTVIQGIFLTIFLMLPIGYAGIFRLDNCPALLYNFVLYYSGVLVASLLRDVMSHPHCYTRTDELPSAV